VKTKKEYSVVIYFIKEILKHYILAIVYKLNENKMAPESVSKEMKLEAVVDDNKNVKFNNGDNQGFVAQCVDYFMSKFRGIMGVEFAEFGGIRRLSKINLVHPTFLPTMLGDVQDRVHATLVRQLRQAITGDPDK
jgi:hypothetical protein